MRSGTKLLLKELKTIDWFSKCGSPSESAVKQVRTSSEAYGYYSRLDWENFKNAVSNRFLDMLWGIEDLTEQKQNQISDDLCDSVYRLFDSEGDSIFRRLERNAALIRTVRADVMGVVFETEFANYVKPLFFRPLVYHWYVNGHLPCGWDGEAIDEFWKGNGVEDLPDGKLIVW